MAGILVALILYDQDDREVRKVGRTCLLIGFLVWVVIPFLVFLGLLILGALAVAGLVFNVLSQMD
jgi:ABC-type polysaccharide transport system permease subunit